MRVTISPDFVNTDTAGISDALY